VINDGILPNASAASFQRVIWPPHVQGSRRPFETRLLLARDVQTVGQSMFSGGL
jgi:hypothetical protein